MRNKYLDILTQLGLPKNEAQIYETLVQEGELSVGAIANKSLIHRRNVYDSLKRLIEKGLVFEIIAGQENRFQAVDPAKLSEILAEKMTALENILPEMQQLFRSTPHPEAVFIYKGLEGWKNYMRDILRLGQDVYTIGGGGQWTDEKLKPFLEPYLKKIEERGIKFHILFDYEVKKEKRDIELLGENFRILPKNYSTEAAIDIFADRVVILAKDKNNEINENNSLTIITNQDIANAFRIWFKFMWDSCKN